jgi:hypothetical protein
MESTLRANIVYMDQDTICIEFHHALNVSHDALETRILAEDNSLQIMMFERVRVHGLLGQVAVSLAQPSP